MGSNPTTPTNPRVQLIRSTFTGLSSEDQLGLVATARRLHCWRRNRRTVSPTRAQRRSSFGSKTTHWVAAQIERSRKMKSLRMLTYFQSAFDVIVRAPHARMPRRGSAESRSRLVG